MTSPKSWNAIVLQVPEAAAEELVGSLLHYTRGVQFDDAIDGDCRLSIYLRAAIDPDDAAEATRLALLGAGLDVAACRLRLEQVEDGHWVERYQESLKPFPLGSRFTVFPSGVVEPTERDPLVLVPGRAFGTGEHPTTQLCSEMLEELVTAGSRWRDVGCGTCVLSIVARRCGAAEVIAIDSDEDAIEVAREVLEANGVDGVTLQHADGGSDASETPDGIVANIGAPFFRESIGELARTLPAGGWLIASGILAEDLSDLTPRFVAAGLSPERVVTRDPWAVIVARKAGE